MTGVCMQMGPTFSSEEEKFEAVKINPSSIRWIDDPSEELQLLAVRQDFTTISDIAFPTEAAQLAAVEQWGYAIQYCKNPSKAVQLAAAKQDSMVLYRFIDTETARELAKTLDIAFDGE